MQKYSSGCHQVGCLVITAFVCLLTPMVGSGQDKDDVDLKPITEKHVMIPMRDGKRLSAYLYFPPGKGPWHVVFEQRYADLRGAATRKGAAKLAQEGFVVALVNFRGTRQSEGTWVGYRALGWGKSKDGYDTCEWLAAQPWSSGKVGTFGSSQGGFAQNFLAVTQPPHLVCQYMEDTGLSLFHEGYRIGGTTRPERFKAMAKVCRNPDDNLRLMEEWFRHAHYDDYWRVMNQGSIASFQGRQHKGGANSRGKQQLVIGPWLHGRGNRTNRTAEMVYPENANWPQHDHMVRWFKHWLGGEDNGVEKEPTVRYYVMGAVGEENAPGNVWRTAKDWPPPHTPTSLYLHRGGALAWKAPTDESSFTKLKSDPLKPMPIPGAAFPGAKDARAFEKQGEVRTFTTAPLDKPMEWTGRIRAELFMSSTARDTDVIVRVSDVYPDGKSILIVDYPWRLRYREGFEKEVLMKPGKVYKVAFDVGWISQVFNQGHRIRVTIASTGAPLYEPNPQTGEPLAIEFPKNGIPATNTLHHDRLYASKIIAPITKGRCAFR